MIFKLPVKLKITRVIPFFLIFAASIMMLSNCEKENARPRSYPRVASMPVTNISESGADFSARIYSLGTEPIIDHGFAWGLTDPSIEYSDKILLGVCDTGMFSFRISSSLRKDVKYYVKPFAQTAKHVVYGATQEFRSLGSGAPVVSGFEPHSGSWLDTLTITGQNFSWIASTNSVKLNQAACEILNSSATTLKVLVGRDLADLKSVLSVELAGNVVIDTKDTFSLATPVIKSFYPTSVKWGDTLALIVEQIPPDLALNNISAMINGNSARIIERRKDSIFLIVPEELISTSNSVSLKVFNFTMIASQNLILMPPVIEIIKPLEGTWGSTLVLKGIFNSKSAKNIVTIGGFKANIISASRDSVRVYVPANLTERSNTVILTSAPFTVVASVPFMLLGPYIESIAPLTGISGIDVLIKGNYFSGFYSTTVKFGTFDAYIVEMGNTYIKCRVPTGLKNGPVKITVKTNSQSYTYGQDFIITNPYVTNIYPLTGTFNNLITIEGQNLTSAAYSTYFYFQNDSYVGVSAEIVSKSSNMLVVKIPTSLDSIPKQMDIQVGFAHVLYPGTFILSPPVISSISASEVAPGKDITIKGSNFNPLITGNKVFLGAYALTVKSSTATEIIATIPLGIPNGNHKVSIIVGGYKRTYPDFYNIRSSWSSVSIPSSFIWNSGRGFNESGISSSVKEIGYIMDFTQSRMTAYNPVGNNFSDLGIQDYHFGSGLATVVNKDTLYVLGGDKGFSWYSENMFMWVYKQPTPTNLRNGMAFSIYGQIYYGLTYDLSSSTLDKKLWVYDQGTRSWISKNNFPGYSARPVMSYFTINNKGYVLFSDRVFCEYDPVTDSWKKLSSFPGTGAERYGMISFVINNKAYAGLGTYSVFTTSTCDDIWAYDPVTDSWTIGTYIPGGGRYNSISFVVNNKAYVGFGYNAMTQQSDLYEFDPNFVAK